MWPDILLRKVIRPAVERAGITGKTLSYARNGHPVRISTLRKLAVGLTRLKTMKGLEGLVTVAPSPERDEAEVA